MKESRTDLTPLFPSLKNFIILWTLYIKVEADKTYKSSIIKIYFIDYENKKPPVKLKLSRSINLNKEVSYGRI